MRKFLIYMLTAGFACVVCNRTVSASDLDGLTRRIKAVLPENWELIDARCGIVPRWALSQETCIRLTLAGPVKSGYQFFDDRHRLILYQDTHREAIYLWIAGPGYNSGWTFAEKFKNRLRVCPSWRPKKLAGKSCNVYGYSGWHIFDNTYTRESPRGTRNARFKETATSWPDWEKDLKSAF